MLRHQVSVDQDSIQTTIPIDTSMNSMGVLPPPPTDILDTIWEHYVEGSCDWVLSEPSFDAFVNDETPNPTLLHITGRPGSGKSVLASFQVKRLQDHDYPVQFWYFRHDDQWKRSNRNCLLSLASQMMDSFPGYAQKVLDSGQDIRSIARSDTRSLWQRLIVQHLDKLGHQGQMPLYWVIDALDESESPQVFLGLIATLKSLRFPLRIIFMTRSQTVNKSLDRLKASFPRDRMSQMVVAAPRESLALYVSDNLSWTPWDPELKQWITDRLLEKSQESYLWLSLVMRELMICDTKEQLDMVLNETPGELFDMYLRIEKAISEELRPADVPLVKAILSWVACADRQLTENELKEALKPRFSVLNLKHTASRLCGDLVVVDNNGKFSMVHHTAKDFLLRSATYLAVDSYEAHTLILNKCLSELTDPRFRVRLKTQGCNGLLRYCCLSWPRHLAGSNVANSGAEFIEQLAQFSTTTAFLAWVDAVATAGQLQVLTSTANIMLSYLHCFSGHIVDRNPLTQPLEEMELLRSWSMELVRIVGKFGTHLLRHPSCIYTLIPLFCPPSSMLHQHFHQSGNTTPKLTGISNSGWEDNLAKITISNGKRPKAILCQDTVFGIVTSDKTVNLYSAVTFQRSKTLAHKENIVTAQFNFEGTLVVTGGLKTIKVWNMISGEEVATYANPDGMRAMGAAFSRDSSEIIICCVDSNLRRQTLSEPENWLHVPWQTPKETGIGRGGGTPNCVAFNPDGTQIVISHRTAPLTVWNTETGNRIGRLESRSGRQITRRDNTDYAVRLTWCPGVTEHVVGVFTNGTVFKWYPLDPQAEVMENSVLATEIACSPDGRLIVTAQKDGSLKILNFEDFATVYNLNCMVRPQSVAFSPDGRRIYDLRQSSCNIWEPNALLRLAEQDEKSGDTSSSHYDSSVLSSVASETTTSDLEPVTALSVDASSTLFAFGTDGGWIKICNTDRSDKKTEMGISPLGITCLVLSSNGECVAASSVDRKVVVRKTAIRDTSEHQNLFETKCTSAIHQLLFSHDGNCLLISCGDTLAIWSLADSSRILERPNAGTERTWIAPSFLEPGFVSISPTGVEQILLSDLESPKHWRMMLRSDEEDMETRFRRLLKTSSTQEVDGAEPIRISVDKTLLSSKGSHILVQTSAFAAGAASDKTALQFTLLGTDNLLTENGAGDGTIQGRQLPNPVASLIQIPLGFIHDDLEIRRGSNLDYRPSNPALYKEHCTLAFIDHDFWVRTWSLGDSDGNSKKRFFLPQDWINMEGLKISVMTPDGRFLCPRNGEVAIVHNGHKLDVVEGS